jgi:hypothetical protein
MAAFRTSDTRLNVEAAQAPHPDARLSPDVFSTGFDDGLWVPELLAR